MDLLMTATVIEYRFVLADGAEERFRLELDPVTLEPVDQLPPEPPLWTRLGMHQCPNCPLTTTVTSHCPAALRLVELVDRFKHVPSHETVQVEVVTRERRISQEMSAQRGIGSLMGLLMAASGCPNMFFFRPMALFHAPWAGERETLYRAASTYLLTRYLLRREGKPAELELDGLIEIYDIVHQVNVAFLERLREGSNNDSIINALVLLDTHTLALPFAIRESIKELQHLFAPAAAGEVGS